MNKKTFFAFPLALALLASCGGGQSSASPSSSAPSSSPAPIISSDTSSTGGGGGGGGGQSSSSSSSSQAPTPVVGGFQGVVRIYFHNDTGTERTKRIYIWCDGVDGTEFDWTGYDNAIGAYYDCDIREEPYKGFIAGSLSFIIKNPGTWSGQSADTLIKFSDYESAVTQMDDGTPLMNVYCAPAEGNALDISPDKTDVLGDSFQSFAATTDWKSLEVVGSGAVSEYALYCFDDVYLKMNSLNRAEHLEEYRIGSGNPNKASFKIDIQGGVDPTKTYRISGKFASNPNKTKKKVATFDRLYDTAKFKSDYTYSGELGIKYSATQTEFRLWAPTSTLVRLNIYDVGAPSAYSGDPFADYPLKTAWLTKQNGGVFSGTLTGDLAGMFYTYTLFYGEASYETIDPYATACGVNGLRGAIVDFSKANPTGWDNMAFPKAIKNANELTVYEVHVRDFTAHESWVSNNNNEPGTYNAFAEAGTSYNGVSTGLDHLKELGVNAVQLLPVFDQDNDERTITSVVNGETVVTKPGYNWGYNPQNYNCVEGSYSSDPSKADVRIKEYKNLIFTLAQNNIRTIMDVVYNHVASVTKNAFSIVCPRYFFWYDDSANLIDYSGCGNAVRSDRPMASKFIVDSCCFWAKEYKVKGFRFDLMGVIDTATMRKVKDALYAIDPAIVVYGEGWTGEPSGGAPANPSTTGNVYTKLGDNGKGAIGCFNDAGRDGAKGNTAWGAPTPGDGWISEASTIDNVYNALTQIIGENRHEKKDGVTMDPNQTVNYLACHDNYTLYDQINYLWHKSNKAAWALGTDTFVMEGCADLTALSLFGQGIGFLHGGDEFFRQKVMKKADDPKLFEAMVETYKHGRYNKATGETEYSDTEYSPKDYDHYNYWTEGDGIQIDANTWLVRNSYKYGDAVNAFDWSRKATYKANYEHVKEMVQLRAAQMGNALGQTKAQIAAGGTTCWSYDDLFDGDGKSKTDLLAGFYKGQKDGGTYYIFVNKGNVDPATIGIGNGSYEVIYSSNGKHTKGEVFEVTNNLMGAYKLECLIVKAR